MKAIVIAPSSVNSSNRLLKNRASYPFNKLANGQIDVKVINHCGDKVLMMYAVK